MAERTAAVAPLFRAQPHAFHPVTAQIMGGADKLSAADAFREIYRLVAVTRQAMAAVAGLDLLEVPTTPTIYTRADLHADPIGPNSRLGTYTNFVNVLDMCGIAVPTALRRAGAGAARGFGRHAWGHGIDIAHASGCIIRQNAE